MVASKKGFAAVGLQSNGNDWWRVFTEVNEPNGTLPFDTASGYPP